MLDAAFNQAVSGFGSMSEAPSACSSAQLKILFFPLWLRASHGCSPVESQTLCLSAPSLLAGWLKKPSYTHKAGLGMHGLPPCLLAPTLQK
eukprot:1160090-Pelagomonas_calceolata.AAC.8